MLPSQKIILLVGRLAEEKGHKYAIEALQGIDAQLWIVGDGPLRSEVEKWVTLSPMKNQIRLMGQYDDVRDWMCLADALLLTSTYEGQGLVIVEAMAAGVPVVP